MKKAVLFVACMLLAGCHVISKPEMVRAEELCTSKGGVYKITAFGGLRAVECSNLEHINIYG